MTLHARVIAQRCEVAIFAIRRPRFTPQAKRAAEAGITHCRWLTACDASTCPTCQERDSKVFAFDQPAGFKHPGMVECEDGGAYRCLWKPIVEGFT